MSGENTLTDGALDMIIEQKNDRLVPIVQILGSKMMNGNRIRAVVWDGATLCQHCIMVSEQIDQLFAEGALSKFTIVRLDQYSISTLPKKEDTSVVLVTRLTIIKRGEDVNRKLNNREPFEEVTPSMEASEPLLSSSSFNRQPPTIQKQAPRAPLASGAHTLKSENVCPINVLTPFFNSWIIRVRVTKKGPLKTYANHRGEGKLFNFDCCDSSGEIRITAFNAECDKFYDLIECDRIYLLSKGSIKNANKQFTSLNNDYEITLNNQSVVELCDENDDIPVPQIRYKFIASLADVENTPVKSMVDVIGVIRNVGEPETINSKNGKEMTKREITIVDKSKVEVTLALWDEMATNFSGSQNQIIAVKGASVGDFRGKNLSCWNSARYEIEPEIAETQLVRSWFNKDGSSGEYKTLSKGPMGGTINSSNRYVAQLTQKLITDNGKTDGMKPVYSNINGLIQATSRSANLLYKSCGGSDGKCQKKVTDDSDGLYYCSKCDRRSPTFEWRLMLSLNVLDVTGGMWLTLFQEQAEELLGHKTKQLAELYQKDPSGYSKVINAIRFKSCYFRVGSRLEDYNNEKKVRSTDYKAEFHKSPDRAKRLMTMIACLAKQVNG